MWTHARLCPLDPIPCSLQDFSLLPRWVQPLCFSPRSAMKLPTIAVHHMAPEQTHDALRWLDKQLALLQPYSLAWGVMCALSKGTINVWQLWPGAPIPSANGVTEV